MKLGEERQAEIEAQRARRSETRRLTVPALEAILYEPIPVLDHGFVRPVDYMGGDAAIVQAARVSYGTGTKRHREDSHLIGYLMRHRHTTPFEMCEIKLHVKLPIFVARQWIRHRTANVNEYSARYSVLDREFYVPDVERLQGVREEQIGRQRREQSRMDDLFEPRKTADRGSALAAQSDSNKQGRDGVLSDEEMNQALSRIDWLSRKAYGVYGSLLNEKDGQKKDPERAGLARELARAVLPVNYYTQFYWKVDLHNLLHFLALRADAHAQYEIRVYAEAILERIVRTWAPMTYEAYQEHVAGGERLSAGALAVIRRMIAGEEPTREESGLSPREWRELMTTLGREA